MALRRRAHRNRKCHCEPVPQHWCGNPFPHAFPSGEGGSRVSRKRETDEGHLPLPLGEVPEAERACDYPLSHFVTAPPKWEPRGTDCHTSDIGHWFAMTRVGRRCSRGKTWDSVILRHFSGRTPLAPGLPCPFPGRIGTDRGYSRFQCVIHLQRSTGITFR